MSFKNSIHYIDFESSLNVSVIFDRHSVTDFHQWITVIYGDIPEERKRISDLVNKLECEFSHKASWNELIKLEKENVVWLAHDTRPERSVGLAMRKMQNSYQEKYFKSSEE